MNKNKFGIKVFFSLQILFVVIFLLSCKQSTDTSIKSTPNIVLIMTDDQGYGDIGYHGNPDVMTPFLDSLASRSTRLTNFHVSPVCAPTRASLMTGKYALRTGVYDTYNGGSMMSSEEVTIAEILNEHGYHTGIFGKWHLGDNYPFRPSDQGFDFSLIHKSGGIGQPGDPTENFRRKDSCYFDPVLFKNNKAVKTKGYCSDVYTDEAIRFIKDNEEQPFFMYLAYNAPHTPLQVPREYYELYKDLKIHPERYPVPDKKVNKMNEKDLEDAKRVYAMVTNIDDNLKRLYQAIQENKLLKQTLIIFLTDNGPQQKRYNGGFRKLKGSVYEGGVRVPCFWHWNGVIPENKEIDALSAHIDVLPTIMDICNIQRVDLNIDGQSLLSLLNNKKDKQETRTLFLEWDRGFTQPYRNIAVIHDTMKMVGQSGYYESSDSLELYDLKNDPFEKTDISDNHPEVLNSLKNKFDAWYHNVIRDPVLSSTRILVGTEYENPVVFNRNDMRGAKPKPWDSGGASGYWDVTVVNPGTYSADIEFIEKLDKEGKACIRIGQVQRYVINKDSTTNTVHIPEFQLTRGDFMLEAWYDYSWKKILSPFYVKLNKIN